jgi:AcrR family transcriptional regulator
MPAVPSVRYPIFVAQACRRADFEGKVSGYLLYLYAMRLPASDRKKQLLEIAMKLFSKQGFDGTSTREIADAAGINEALIFRHFRTKEDLFWAVLSDRVEHRGRNRRMRELARSQGDFREVLVGITETLLDRTDDDAAVTRLLLYSALRNPGLSHRFFRAYGQEKLDLLASHICVGIEARHLRAVNPAVAARSVLGMIVYHYLLKEVFGVSHSRTIPTRELAEELVGIFLHGISAERAISKRVGGAKNGTRTIRHGDIKTLKTIR